jgi:uncharacterized membrane protein
MGGHSSARLASVAVQRRVAALAGILGGSGVLHFVAPGFYERIVPPRLGSPKAWVFWSGVAELAVAGLVAAPPTRKNGGLAAAALFLAVFPANVYHVTIARNRVERVGTLLRLPLQIPMITTALTIAREADEGGLSAARA